MNKEIVKRNFANNPNVVLDPNLPKPPRKPYSYTTIGKISILPVLIIQTVVSVYLTQREGFNSSYMGLGQFLAIVLAIIYLIMSICVDRNQTPKMQLVRELVLVSSMLLFLFMLQWNFLNNRRSDTHFVEDVINFSSIFGMLTVFIIVQNILKMSIYSRMILISYFFIFLCLIGLFHYKLKTPSTYLNTIVPLALIGLLTFVQGKLTKKHMKIKKIVATSNFAEFFKDNIFTYDKQGNLNQLNDWSLKENSDDPNPTAIEVFRKIKDLKLISEERLVEKNTEKNDESGEISVGSPKSSSTMKLNPGAKTTRELKHVVIQLDDSFQGQSISTSFDTMVKTMYLQVMRKELDDKKVLNYQATFTEKKRIYNLGIRVFICPKGLHPIVIVMRDETATQQLEEHIACERTRETMFKSIATEINNVIDMSRMILETSLQNIQACQSLDIIKATLVSSTEQILVPMIVATGDIIDFCSSKTTKLNFSFAPCDLRKAIQKCIRLFYFQAIARNIQIVFEAREESENNFLAYTDEKRLIQLLMRLLSNSIKFSSNGMVKVILKAYANTFAITIEDSGCGIPPQALEKINEELKTYQYNNIKTLHSKCGKNQGLPIAQMLAAGIGPKTTGGLSIKSEVNTGTSVSFIIEDNQVDTGRKKMDPLYISTGSPTRNNNTQKSSFSPARPSKFRMTYDYEGPGQNSFEESEFSESVEVNNVYQPLDSKLMKRMSEENPQRNIGIVKSQFAEGEMKRKSRSEPRTQSPDSM